MNSRQRLLCVLEGHIPDRVPVVAWIDPTFLIGYLGHGGFDPIIETINVAKTLGFDVIVRLVLGEIQAWETDAWRLRTQVSNANGARRRTKTIETPGGELREVVIIRELRPGCVFYRTEEHLVKTRDDLDLFEFHFCPFCCF